MFISNKIGYKLKNRTNFNREIWAIYLSHIPVNCYFILNFNSISISWGTKNSYLSTKLIAYFKRYALKKTRYKWTSVGKIVIRGRRCKRFFCRRQKPIYSNVKSKNFVCPLKRIFSFCYVM